MMSLALASQSNLTVLVFGPESKTLVTCWYDHEHHCNLMALHNSEGLLGLRTSAEHWPLGRSVESCAAGSTVLHLHLWNACLATVVSLRPHRARMWDKMLADLVFLKCNKYV